MSSSNGHFHWAGVALFGLVTVIVLFARLLYLPAYNIFIQLEIENENEYELHNSSIIERSK